MLKVHTPSDIFTPIGPYAQTIEATSVVEVGLVDPNWLIEVEAVAVA